MVGSRHTVLNHGCKVRSTKTQCLLYIRRVVCSSGIRMILRMLLHISILESSPLPFTIR